MPPSDEALRNMTVIQLCELIEQMAAIIKEQQTQIEMFTNEGP